MNSTKSSVKTYQNTSLAKHLHTSKPLVSLAKNDDAAWRLVLLVIEWKALRSLLLLRADVAEGMKDHKWYKIVSDRLVWAYKAASLEAGGHLVRQQLNDLKPSEFYAWINEIGFDSLRVPNRHDGGELDDLCVALHMLTKSGWDKNAQHLAEIDAFDAARRHK